MRIINYAPILLEVTAFFLGVSLELRNYFVCDSVEFEELEVVCLCVGGLTQHLVSVLGVDEQS